MLGEGRERGFIVLHRRVRSSALYQSLSAEQRSVFLEVLLACNWKPSRMLYAGKWVEIDRGEFADSLETIAQRAAVSVKVVRTTYKKLAADDSTSGGRGPFILGRWSGTREGTGLRVIRVVRYDEFQRIEPDEGTPPGTAVGTAGARLRHASGTAGAASEPREPEEPSKPGGAGGLDVGAELTALLERRIRPETFRKFFARLRFERDGASLVVEAPDRYQRDFVRDNYAVLLAEALGELNHPLQLEFTVAAAPRHAAGGV